jgi:hypothetical protein
MVVKAAELGAGCGPTDRVPLALAARGLREFRIFG